MSREGRIEENNQILRITLPARDEPQCIMACLQHSNNAMTARQLRHENPNVVKTHWTDAREIMHVDLIGAGGGSLIGGA